MRRRGGRLFRRGVRKERVCGGRGGRSVRGRSSSFEVEERVSWVSVEGGGMLGVRKGNERVDEEDGAESQEGAGEECHCNCWCLEGDLGGEVECFQKY